MRVAEARLGATAGFLRITSGIYYERLSSGLRCAFVDVVCDESLGGCGTMTVVSVGNLGRTVLSCGCYRRAVTAARSKGVRRIGTANPNWKGDKGVRSREKWILAEKDGPCTDCGVKYPSYVMQFDHVPERGAKLFTVSLNKAHHARSLDELRAERAKCDLVCANCHFERTHKRHVERRAA